MQLHKLACSYISLHAVTYACMQLHKPARARILTFDLLPDPYLTFTWPLPDLHLTITWPGPELDNISSSRLQEHHYSLIIILPNLFFVWSSHHSPGKLIQIQIVKTSFTAMDTVQVYRKNVHRRKITHHPLTIAEICIVEFLSLSFIMSFVFYACMLRELIPEPVTHLRSRKKGDQRLPLAFVKALTLIQKIFKKYFESQDKVISGYGVRQSC